MVPGWLVWGLLLYPRHPIDAIGLLTLGIYFYALHLSDVRKAHFPWSSNILAFLGLPLYASLLWRSWLRSKRRGEVTWKGRKYRQSAPQGPANSSTLGKAD